MSDNSILQMFSTVGKIFSLQNLALILSYNVLQKFENHQEKVLPKSNFEKGISIEKIHGREVLIFT